MARAKRTDRAEARRRYRAAIAAQLEAQAEGEGDDDEAPELAAAATPRVPRPRGTAQPEPAAAPRGFLGPLRAAAHPADIRGDIAALPHVARTSKAVWLPALVILGGGIIGVVPALRENAIGILAFQLAIYPPPMIPAFLAGMLAPRGAWLVGGLMGALSVIALVPFALTYEGSTAVPFSPDLRTAFILQALLLSPITGMGVGAFSGFYRRFLRLAGPQPQRRGTSKPTGKRR